MTRILVVDDEPQILRALRINLHARRYDVVTAADGATAPVDVRHASVDAAFPYRICGVDANEDGFCVSSRGNDAGETASVEAIPISRPGQLIADPQEPDLIYGGALSRYDRRTGQVQLIGPRDVGAGDGSAKRDLGVLVEGALDSHLGPEREERGRDPEPEPEGVEEEHAIADLRAPRPSRGRGSM